MNWKSPLQWAQSRTEAKGLQLELCRPSEVDQADLARWRDWHGKSPLAMSPFVHPTFFAAAGATFEETRVILLRDAGQTIGFMPVHVEGREALSVGGALNDGDGIVMKPDLSGTDLRLDALALLRSCKLNSFTYAHMPVCASPFSPFHYKTSPTARVDVGAGLAEYERRMTDRGSGVLNQLRRKARKIERECGPLRFDLQTQAAEFAPTLVDWKAQQVEQRGHGTPMRDNRLIKLLAILAEARPSEDFSSVVSALHAGDRLVSLIWSLRSRHHWVLSVPTHDPQLGDYSPGAVAHLKLIEALCALDGVTEVDLGLAVNPLKARLMTHSVDFAQGTVHVSALMRAYRRAKTLARIAIKGA